MKELFGVGVSTWGNVCHQSPRSYYYKHWGYCFSRGKRCCIYMCWWSDLIRVKSLYSTLCFNIGKAMGGGGVLLIWLKWWPVNSTTWHAGGFHFVTIIAEHWSWRWCVFHLSFLSIRDQIWGRSLFWMIHKISRYQCLFLAERMGRRWTLLMARLKKM